LLRIGDDQIAQRHRPEQFAGGVEDVTGVDGVAVAGLGPDTRERRRRGHVRFQANELGRHDAAGRAIGVLQQLLDLGLYALVELRQQPGAFVRTHRADDVGPLVGRQAVEDVGRPARLQALEDGRPATQCRLRGDADLARDRQEFEDSGRLGACQTIEGLGHVGVRQSREVLGDAGAIDVQVMADVLRQFGRIQHGKPPGKFRAGDGIRLGNRNSVEMERRTGCVAPIGIRLDRRYFVWQSVRPC
jgi:hypothetical protein